MHPMAAPPELIADSITEILLRLPPDEPECLVRASLVCKLWRRILLDPTFPHRYREFHRTPPLLGFLCCSYHKAGRFVPVAARVPLPRPPFGCEARDCRHGRVLLDSVGGKKESLAMWDPITGGHKLFRDPEPDSFYRSGVVLCAAAGCDDHRACHGGPFVVVLVGSPLGSTKVSARVYSSDRDDDDDAWSAPASLQLPQGSSIYQKRGAIVRDQIYFLLTAYRILKYDMGKHCLTTIGLPSPYMYAKCYPGILMAMENGSSLGFVTIKDLTLHLWARKMDPEDGSMGWVQDTVDLPSNLVPVVRTTSPRCSNVIGFADGVDILLLGDYASGYMFELKSRRFKKLSYPEYHFYDVLPYMSFYIPDFASHKSPLPAKKK